MPAIFSKLFKKKSKKGVVSPDSDSPTPSPVSPNAPSSSLAAPVAVNVDHLNSIPEAVISDASHAHAPPEDATPTPAPESSSTSPAVNSQSAATTNDDPAQIIRGNQRYRAEVTNNNEAGSGTAQTYEGRQQFFEAVTNNNIATSSSNTVDYGNTNSIITGDAIIHVDAEGRELQISQRTTSNTLLPATPAGMTAPQPLASTPMTSPSGPTQKIIGSQVFHAEMTNTNTLGSGTAQVIDGDQEFWGPVVNNNSRTTNSNISNSHNVNSTITGNSYRIRESAPMIGPADIANFMLTNVMANQHGAPNTQTRYLTNSSGQGIMPLQDNGSILNAFKATSPQEQMNYQFMMAMAQAQAPGGQYSR